jgi:hypothetical protein
LEVDFLFRRHQVAAQDGIAKGLALTLKESIVSMTLLCSPDDRWIVSPKFLDGRGPAGELRVSVYLSKEAQNKRSQ